jgi:hypothetical protein
MRLKALTAVVAACTTLGLGTGVSTAAFQSSGDQYYYAAEPFGTLYCAAYNWSIHTNTTGGNSQGINFVLDAKSKRDVFCGNPAPAPAGYNLASYDIYATKNGRTYYCSSSSGTNPSNDWVGRASDFTNVAVLAYISGKAECFNGSYFSLRFQTRIALNLAYQYYPNSYSYASTPAVYAQP